MQRLDHSPTKPEHVHRCLFLAEALASASWAPNRGNSVQTPTDNTTHQAMEVNDAQRVATEEEGKDNADALVTHD